LECCSEPDRQNHFLTFLFAYRRRGLGRSRTKIERKWFWSGGSPESQRGRWRGGLPRTRMRRKYIKVTARAARINRSFSRNKFEQKSVSQHNRKILYKDIFNSPKIRRGCLSLCLTRQYSVI
jgi:hypothetical protein